MNILFNLQEKIRKELQDNVLINQVTYGDLFEVDLLKRNIFPLAHVGMQGAIVSSESGISTINISVLFLDLVDETKEDTTDNFYGNDNEHFVINNMYSAAMKLVQELMRGTLYSEGFQLEEDVNFEFFSERFEDKLAGVGVDMSINIKNDFDLC